MGIAILAVWWPAHLWPSALRLPLWGVLFAASVVVAVAEGVLAPAALVSLAALTLACLLSVRLEAGRLRGLATLVASGLALLLAVHALPGFNNLLVVDGQRITPDAVPFTLYANFDKATAGLFLLAFYCQRGGSWQEAGRAVRAVWLVAIGTTVAVIGSAWAMVVVQPEFKFPSFAPAFLAINLLFTCVAEEAFFRGLIQERLTHWVGGRRSLAWLPVVVSAVLFAMVHAAGGSRYVLLAAIAGLGYGLAYAKTRRIEAALLTHYGVNVVHFLFFTYPMLAG
ncbi:CPBP family intramembrane glutamic endopeptidase [Pseudogulbenkiania sp. MAI-1]|uniref:CPBP family intramembrane glutamic endopeptidase n=1 Tax=Pseudogulbenkiania sp. MAI-1 TaxID=990370 RepID=UPI0004A312C9|nr:CPBP family intramembrane glutamic endopeptidase [Pseudogulbenkiania sp. MAI-1]